MRLHQRSLYRGIIISVVLCSITSLIIPNIVCLLQKVQHVVHTTGTKSLPFLYICRKRAANAVSDVRECRNKWPAEWIYRAKIQFEGFPQILTIFLVYCWCKFWLKTIRFVLALFWELNLNLVAYVNAAWEKKCHVNRVWDFTCFTFSSPFTH